MSSVTPSIPPGRYPTDNLVTWEFASNVQQIAYTIDGLPPALSEYIAYDRLTPPNPFIAVTQDGRGNVLYDGGFPKLYNTQNAAGHNATIFDELTPAQKYFHNAIHWCASPTTVAQHGKRILILGDANSDQNYNILGTGGNHFRSTVEAICRVAGYTPTYLTRSHWGSQINCTLSELTQYACIFFFSTYSADFDCITDNAVQDILTYRSLGGGLIFITDHGAVINSIENAWPVPGGTFFRTANKIIRNFGAWFSGDYNRTPVNVGFIRQTYGDHPLYANISDDENIYAGGSESRVFVNTVDTIDPSEMPEVPITEGETRIQVLARLDDGSVETFNFMYDVTDDKDILIFTDLEDNPIEEIDIGWDDHVTVKLRIEGEGQATLLGSIYRNTSKIGEFRYDQNTGSRVIWYVGEGAANYVNNDDRIRAVIEQPYTYEKQVKVIRKQLITGPKVSSAPVMKSLKAYLPDVDPRWRLYEVIKQINQVQSVNYTTSQAENIQGLSEYMDGTREHFEMQAFAYDNPTDLEEALRVTTPPELKDIFNNWDRTMADQYWAKGIGATGDAAAWYWDNNTGSAVQPNNAGNFVAFISDETPISYDMAVTFVSNSPDDDFNYLVLAHYRDSATNRNHSISVQISRAAYGHSGAPFPNYAVVLDAANTSRQRVIVSNRFNEQEGGWTNKRYRVWATRRGDQFTVYGSGWNTLTKKPESLMSFNLNDSPDLAKFKQPLPYGFGSKSQPNSSFIDIDYVGGINYYVILDMLNRRIYSWYDNQWNVTNNVNLHGVYKAPRVITSIDTGKKYRLNLDGTVTFL